MDDKKYHEINKYRDSLFPVEIYRVNENGVFPFGRGVQDFHWHDELQFTLAVHGSLTMQVDGGQYCLNEGDAIFINSGMIHAVTKLSRNGQYSSLNFPYKLLSFFPGSRMEKDYVLPYVTGNSGGCLPAVILRPETKFHSEKEFHLGTKSHPEKEFRSETEIQREVESPKSALDILQEINALWDNHALVQKKYLISIKIASLWYALISNLSGERENTISINLVHRQRLQLMLSFIYEHYSEDLALADIAEAAHISVGECCRIFREHLQITPYQFLTEYRVRKSVEMLSGELSVSEIAGLCGYNQTSNYIAKFKSIMGCTPAQYRKRNW